MTWAALQLATPASPTPALTASVAVISVTPWEPQTGGGVSVRGWLGFPNAIDALINKIGSVDAVFAIAVSAANASDLADQIDNLTTAFPVKQLLQWQRHAATLVNLEQTKLDLVELVTVSNELKINAIPEVKARGEKALAIQELTAATDLAASDPLANLTAFEASKTVHDAAVNAALPALAGGAGWRFYSDGDISADLKTGHPGPEYSLTAILAFTGSPADLSYLTELMP